MQKYEILIEKSAKKQLSAIPEPYLTKIELAIRKLESDPRPSGCKKLTNRLGYRIRIGVYRIIYKIEDNRLLILVVDIAHRQGIYS